MRDLPPFFERVLAACMLVVAVSVALVFVAMAATLWGVL